jgi:alpha-beta hydrolase superfamily lysophospholipase
MLGLTATALAAAVTVAPGPVQTTTVPFKLIDNRIVVQTRLNGAGPYAFVFDTGSSGSVITPQVARRLHIVTKPAGYIGGIAGSARVAVSTADVADIMVGAMHFPRISSLVVDMSRIQRNIGFPHLDGIIGYDCFGHLSARVDMDGKTLTLSTGALSAPPSARSVPFSVDGGLIWVPATINDVDGTILLDSGDRSSLTLFKKFAQQNHFYDTTPAARDVLTGFGIGGPVYADVFRTRLSIFGTAFSSVVTRASRDAGGAFATAPQAGSVGTGVLKRFNVIYDYRQRTLRLWPSRYFNVADRYDPAGLWLSANGRDVMVAATSDGGPAQRSGIQTGDTILSVDGRARWTALELREWLAAQSDGAHVSIVTRDRSGRIARHQLALADATLGQPASAATLPRHAIFGAAVVDKAAGVTVARVIPGSPAANAGVVAGDVIKSIGSVRVTNIVAFLDQMHVLHANSDVTVVIFRGNTRISLRVLLAAAPNENDPEVTTLYGTVNVANTLRRTLITIPHNPPAPRPAVLLIGGVGCYSVDVAANPQDPYLRLTHDLSRAGFVTMRLEKSGVGDSQGPPCRNVDFFSESHSYAVALEALKRDPHVDPKRLYLFGHSIGSIIAPQLALTSQVSGVIVAEAVGRDWPEYELRNTRRQLEVGGSPPVEVDENVLQKASCMQRLLVEKQPEAQIERAMPECKAHNGVYPVTAAYVQEVVPLNIIAPWTKLDAPVLAIYGSSDFVTEEADHRRIVDVVNGVHAGRATLTILAGMDHYLAQAATAKISYDNAQNAKPEPYDENLSRAVIEWLAAH